MLEIRWIITDDLSSVTPEVFDTEWCGIVGGWFEFIINGQREGFCPQRKIEKGEEGLEDVLYWLICLSEGVKKIKANEEYEMFLLTRNQYKIMMRLDDDVKISFVNVATNTVKWTERIELREFEQEVQESIDKFIGIIKDTNLGLLKSEWMKKLF